MEIIKGRKEIDPYAHTVTSWIYHREMLEASWLSSRLQIKAQISKCSYNQCSSKYTKDSEDGKVSQF